MRGEGRADGLAGMKSVRPRSDDVGDSAMRLVSSEPPSHLLLPGLRPAAAVQEEKKGSVRSPK